MRTREDFRVVAYSLQTNHVHMIVEAAENEAMASGMKAVASRLARAVNRVFHRSGKVLEGRYHLRALTTPREVRNAIAYVLLNIRKHYLERKGFPPPVRIDAASSGRWFDGWLHNVPSESLGPDIRDVSPARSWFNDQRLEKMGSDRSLRSTGREKAQASLKPKNDRPQTPTGSTSATPTSASKARRPTDPYVRLCSRPHRYRRSAASEIPNSSPTHPSP